MMYVLQGRGILTIDTKRGKSVVVAAFVHVFPCHRFTPTSDLPRVTLLSICVCRGKVPGTKVAKWVFVF